MLQHDAAIAALIDRLQRLQPDPGYRDDQQAIFCCRLALDALEQGSYGVAAILIDPQGRRVAQSENRVFSQAGYHSSAHAEMLLIDQLEAGLVPYQPEALTLLVTLEPCPMCLARLLLSGIGSVRYIAADHAGGMLTHADKLPPAWRNLMQLQQHYKAHVSPSVKQLAADIAATHLASLRHKLLLHIRP
ncbi:nucleoside deaminase [Amphritea sp. 1_MG-2023]|uniref:nucleoside deaminase n=1 Tax=Amphritea sp. 1_MG-2023 TaxID=3062670 RepID=UPI0026E3D1B2|nr:nucleoside deaminase [Amphritea sp. 1_MG-2023]MDO6562207.1 nucleoside deaminase [Amphritea sp. 1_MG-2023]